MSEINTKLIPVNDIADATMALRKVETGAQSFQELVDSIKTHGILQPIIVRPTPPDMSDKPFVLVDGLHRLTAARAAGLEFIPASIMNLSEIEAMTAQIITNSQRVATKNAEYAKQLLRILSLNPLMTMLELANMISRSESYVSQLLSLPNLPESVQTLVNEGRIKLVNAFQLAKLKDNHDAVMRLLDQAIEKPFAEFAPVVKKEMEEISKARREGREVSTVHQFVAIPHIRKVSELREAAETGGDLANQLNDSGLTDPIDVAKFTLNWALSLDPKTLEAAEQKWNAAEETKRLRKEEAAKKRAEARAKEAAEIAADAAEGSDVGQRDPNATTEEAPL